MQNTYTPVIEDLLRAVHVFCRAVEQVLDEEAVRSAIQQNLAASKVRLMRLLAQEGSHSLGHLARFLGVSEPGASQLVDSLVRAGLIRRAPDEKDRRAVHLSLEPSGQEMIEAIDREQRHRLALAAREFETSDADWGRICETLERLAAALVAGEAAHGEYCLQCNAYQQGGCVMQGHDHECPYLQARNRQRRKS